MTHQQKTPPPEREGLRDSQSQPSGEGSQANYSVPVVGGPGGFTPWVAEPSGVVGFGAPVIASGPGQHVAWLTRGQPGDGWPAAYLIAAAPELLEALTELVKVIDHPAMHVLWCEMIDKLSTYRGPRFDVDKARAAIAKAVGPPTSETSKAEGREPLEQTLRSQIAELRKAIAEAEGQNRLARVGLETAIERFEEYAALHAAKGTPDGDEKARRNADMAYSLRACLPGDEA